MTSRTSEREYPMTPPPSGLRSAVAGLLALAVAMGVGRFAFTPLLPMMQEDAGVTVAGGGWLASANYLGYLLGAVAAMVVRARAAVAIRAGLIAIGLLTGAMAYTDSFGAWLALRAAAGIANAWVAIHVFSWCLERLEPAAAPLLKGVVFSGVGAGIASVGLLCLVLMQSGVASDRAWLALGVLSLILAGCLWRVFGSGDGAVQSEDDGPLLPGGGRWDLNAAGLVICFGATGFGYIVSATFLPAMARQAVSDPSLFGWAWPAFGAAAMVSTLAAAMLAGRIGNRRLWMASQWVMAIGVAAPAIFPGLPAILVSALCVGGTFMVITMASMQEARVARGRDATGLIAALTAAFALGQIVGPLVAAHAAGRDGDFSGALLIASLVLAAGTLGLLAGRDAVPGPGRRTNPSPFTWRKSS